MVQGIQGVGFAPTDRRTPMDKIADRVEKRQMVKDELRFKDLLDKEKAGTLTKQDKIDLYFMKAERMAAEFAKMPKVEYVA